MNSSMETIGRKGEWFVHDPQGRQEDCGPYSTREEAEEDRRGLERFWAAWKPAKAVKVLPEGMLF